MKRLVLAATLLAAAPCGAQVVNAPADTALSRCIGQRITKISVESMGPEFREKIGRASCRERV